jgi:hypothetical protein
MEMLGELRGECYPREVVVGDGWMTAVARDQDLVVGLAREKALAVGEVPLLERRVDPDLVHTVGELLQLCLPHAESPRLRVIGVR